MKINGMLTDEAILAEIGMRLARMRLEQNRTQEEIATQAGVAKRTVERMEKGIGGARLTAFFRVCRVLGILERLELLVPEPTIGPMQLLKLQKKTRLRARRRKEKPMMVEEEQAPWKWGDDA